MDKKLKKTKIILFAAMVGIMPAASLGPAEVYAATSKAKLDAPDNLAWTDKKDEEEGTYASWSEVEHAKEYEVYLYYMNDNDNYSKLAEVKTKKTKINLLSKMSKDADYAFRVRAVGRSGYSTSNWSDYSDTLYVEKNEFKLEENKGFQNSGPGVKKDTEENQPATATTQTDTQQMTAGWKKNDTGWWYATAADGSTWYTDSWQWIDGNGDGVSECYCFDSNGYIYTRTTTPDGYQVNADGAWIINDVIQSMQK